MRVSERGQVTIPKTLRNQFGLNHNVEVEMIPTKRGLLIQKRTTAAHPVELVYGVLGGGGGNTDDLIEEIRGR